MLNNPNWNAVKQDIFTKESLIAWLEQQDPDTTYRYTNGRDCLICRYLKTMGLDVSYVSPTTYVVDDIWYSLPAVLNTISLKGYGTYGRALVAARGIKDDV